MHILILMIHNCVILHAKITYGVVSILSCYKTDVLGCTVVLSLKFIGMD